MKPILPSHVEGAYLIPKQPEYRRIVLSEYKEKK